MCQTCSAGGGGGGGGAAAAVAGLDPQGPDVIAWAIPIPIPIPAPMPAPIALLVFWAAAVIASAAANWVYLFKSPTMPMDVRLSITASTDGGRDMFSI